MKDKAIILVLIFSVTNCLYGCNEKNVPVSDAIVIEETLVSENSIKKNSSYVYIEKAKINKGETTNEASGYSEIENLMIKIADETGGPANAE